METLLNNRRPVAVAFTDEQVIVTLSDGSTVGNPLSWHWWLEAATNEQRKNVEFYADSIEWIDLDEGWIIASLLRHFSGLSAGGAKQKTTRYAGGEEIPYRKNHKAHPPE